MSTSGGEADTGGRNGEELRLWQEEGREIFFLGRTHVFSAGVTIMASVPPDHRFLTLDTESLIHERRMKQDVVLDGAMRGCRSTVQNLLADIESGQHLEHDDFKKLVEGTPLSLPRIIEHGDGPGLVPVGQGCTKARADRRLGVTLPSPIALRHDRGVQRRNIGSAASTVGRSESLTLRRKTPPRAVESGCH